MKKALCLVLVAVLALSCFSLFACKPEVADNTKYYDKITKTLKLTKSFEGKSFLTDGIGEATLDALTDGDTTRFNLVVGGQTVVIRYYCINTPESTGGVEKWGKAASLFVKSKLNDPSTKIVLEATDDTAQKDNYGRYLGYVWYKTKDATEYKNLNLELIENGFTDNKALNTSDYAYYSYMKQANDFAHSIKLRIYSDLADPLYSTDPVEMTIKDFWTNTDAYYSAETDSGAKVTFQACLTSLQISSTGTHTYTAVQYDAATGETYKINVYCGYASSPASNMPLGHLYTITGNIQNYYGNFQVSGISYNPILGVGKKDYTNVLQRNYYLTFDYSVDYNARYVSTLYTDVTVVSSSVTGTTLTIVGTAQQKKADDQLGEAVTFTFKVPVGANYVNVFTAGKTFSVKGFQTEKDSHNVTVLNYSDIKIK